VEACEDDADVDGETKDNLYQRQKDESEVVVACNTAVGSMQKLGT